MTREVPGSIPGEFLKKKSLETWIFLVKSRRFTLTPPDVTSKIAPTLSDTT